MDPNITSLNPPNPPIFNMDTLSFLLTYSQCPLPREAIRDLVEAIGPVQRGVVGQEHHQDGNKHLHCYVKYDKRMHITNSRVFDIEGYHPNIKSAKSAYGSIKYCVKEDETPLEFGTMDYKSELKARENKKKVLGKRLVEDREDLIDIIQSGEYQYICGFRALQLDIEAFQLASGSRREVCDTFIPNELGRDQGISLNLPILKGKLRHYWIWSTEPNKGKTEFLKSIFYQFKASWYNKTELFQNVERDSQFLLFDEYTTPFLNVQNLNQMCDGTYQYPSKGGKPTILKDPILLVCGNQHPLKMYTNKFNHPLIKARFNIIELE